MKFSVESPWMSRDESLDLKSFSRFPWQLSIEASIKIITNVVELQYIYINIVNDRFVAWAFAALLQLRKLNLADFSRVLSGKCRLLINFPWYDAMFGCVIAHTLLPLCLSQLVHRNYFMCRQRAEEMGGRWQVELSFAILPFMLAEANELSNYSWSFVSLDSVNETETLKIEMGKATSDWWRKNFRPRFVSQRLTSFYCIKCNQRIFWGN